MEILINQKPLSFELTGEKNLFDVLKGLEDWASKQSFFISQVVINDEKVVEYQDEKLKAIKIAEVKKLECTVLSSVSYVVSIWSDLKTYFNPFYQLDESQAKENFDEIINRINWIKEVILKVKNIFTVDDNQDLMVPIKELEIELFKFKNQNLAWNQEKINEIIKEITARLDKELFKLNLKILQVGLKNNPQDLRHSIENYCIFLDLFENYLVETSIDFQKSKFKDAFEKLTNILDSLEIFINLDSKINQVFLVETFFEDNDLLKETREKYQVELKEQLVNLEEAIKKNDFIDASDIIEYEIKERIPEIKQCLKEILKEVDEYLKITS